MWFHFTAQVCLKFDFVADPEGAKQICVLGWHWFVFSNVLDEKIKNLKK